MTRRVSVALAARMATHVKLEACAYGAESCAWRLATAWRRELHTALSNDREALGESSILDKHWVNNNWL